MTIRIPHQNRASELLDKAKAQGVIITGTPEAGSFSYESKVEGTYAIDGDDLVLTITKKPWALPGAMLESMLRKAIGR